MAFGRGNTRATLKASLTILSPKPCHGRDASCVGRSVHLRIITVSTRDSLVMAQIFDAELTKTRFRTYFLAAPMVPAA